MKERMQGLGIIIPIFPEEPAVIHSNLIAEKGNPNINNPLLALSQKF
jgi:hypothetical protein